MRGPVFILLVVLAFLVPFVGGAQAQRPADPHGTVSPVMPSPSAASSAPVIPDTATAILNLPESLPEGAADPVRVSVLPDTVVFGGVIQVVLEPSHDDGYVPVLEHETPWLETPVVDESGRLARLLGQEVPTPAPNSYRVYRTDPFRIQVGDAVSAVIHVRGRADGTGEVASIRTPPFPGLPWLTMIGAAFLIGLLILLVAWLWGRRHGPVVWPDRPVGTPAWLDAATGLDALIQGGSLSRGESSRFLDGLASLARRYMAGRYGVAATEMTGPEIVTACRVLGYPLGPVRVLANLIDEADRHRYDPEPPRPAWCREQAVGFYVQVQATRVMPRVCPVEPARILEAEKAWAAVARELDPTGRMLADQSRGGVV